MTFDLLVLFAHLLEPAAYLQTGLELLPDHDRLLSRRRRSEDLVALSEPARVREEEVFRGELGGA